MLNSIDNWLVVSGLLASIGSDTYQSLSSTGLFWLRFYRFFHGGLYTYLVIYALVYGFHLRRMETIAQRTQDPICQQGTKILRWLIYQTSLFGAFEFSITFVCPPHLFPLHLLVSIALTIVYFRLQDIGNKKLVSIGEQLAKELHMRNITDDE